MVKVRFLQSVILPKLGKVMNFNDELELSDEKLVKDLSENGTIDILIDEKITKEPAKKAPKRAKTEADLDV